MFNGVWPTDGLESAQLPLVLARGLWLAALLSATGALGFRALEARAEAMQPQAVRAGIGRIVGASLGLAVLAWIAWVALQAQAIAGESVLASLGPVFSRTAFGHVAAAQLVLVLLAALGAWRGWHWPPAALAFAATGLQVAHLHAWAMTGGPSVLGAAVLLHLWAAAAWLGGLLPLAVVVRHAPPEAAQALTHRFSNRAIGLVAVLAATILVQGAIMLGGLPGIVGTVYGWTAFAKAALFAVLIGFAARHRRMMARLAAVRGALARSIVAESGVGVLVLLAAATLSALPPGMHEQPVWPFTLRPDFSAGAAVRLVAATPTTYYRSPDTADADAIADGLALYAKHCAACHATPPSLARWRDGDLFWLIGQGAPGMPGFAAKLDEDARWHVIEALRAMDAAGRMPVRAPDADLVCADGTTPALSELHGHPVHLSFDATPPQGACRLAEPELRAVFALLAGRPLAGRTLLIDADGMLIGLQ